MKIRQIGAELFHAEGRTDMTKLSLFANSRTRPRTVLYCHSHPLNATRFIRLIMQMMEKWLRSPTNQTERNVAH